MRKKNKRRLGAILGVLALVYFEEIKSKVEVLSKILAVPLKFITRQIRTHKPKSKRMQYIVLLCLALVAKYLTRFDVFPDDLDQHTNLPSRSNKRSQQSIELSLTNTNFMN